MFQYGAFQGGAFQSYWLVTPPAPAVDTHDGFIDENVRKFYEARKAEQHTKAENLLHKYRVLSPENDSEPEYVEQIEIFVSKKPESAPLKLDNFEAEKRALDKFIAAMELLNAKIKEYEEDDNLLLMIAAIL